MLFIEASRITYRSPPSRDRIPALLRRETRRVAPDRTAARDVREGEVANGVEPRVQEAQRRSALGDQRIVNEGEDGARGGCSGAGAVEPRVGTVPGGDEVEALG